MSHEPCPEQEAADGKGVTAMPEAPDLEVIRDFLGHRIRGDSFSYLERCTYTNVTKEFNWHSNEHSDTNALACS